MQLDINALADKIGAENYEIDVKEHAREKKLINKTIYNECGDVDKLYEDANADSKNKKKQVIKKGKTKKVTKWKVMNEEQKKVFFEELRKICEANEAKAKAEEEAKRAQWAAKLEAEKAAAAKEAMKKAAEKSNATDEEKTETKKPIAVISRKSIEKAQNSLLSKFKKEMGGKDEVTVANTVKKGVVLRRRRSTGRCDI